jgi:hypothetical protein
MIATACIVRQRRHDVGVEIDGNRRFFLRPVMALQLHAVAGIERAYWRAPLRDAGQPLLRAASSSCRHQIDLELVVDRRLLLDGVTRFSSG